MQRTHRVWLVITVTMLVTLSAPIAAGAMPEGEPKAGAFTCRASATRLGDEITLTFSLRTGRAGRHWQIRIWGNDLRLFSRDRVTSASGNIRVRIGAEDMPGRDVFRFRASHETSGSVCRVDDLRV